MSWLLVGNPIYLSGASKTSMETDGVPKGLYSGQLSFSSSFTVLASSRPGHWAFDTSVGPGTLARQGIGTGTAPAVTT